MNGRKSFRNLKEEVIDKGLCTSCGACKGICPAKVIDYADRENNCVPTLIGDCMECGLCMSSCVAAGFNVTELSDTQGELYGKKEKKPDESFYLCHARNELIWKNGASGGFVTAALLYAFRKGIIKYASVIIGDPEKPWLPKVVLAENEDQLIDAMQSKYCVVPTLEILNEIALINEPVAMVLLPCQGQAFMNIRQKYPKKFTNVVFTIGLMCGNSLPFDATKDVLNNIGVSDVTKIKRLKYRDGFWHGELHVCLEDETERSIAISKYMRYMADFYRKDRCKVCIDGDAMFTDISSGDGWLPNNKQDGVYGWSIVHTHSKVGEQLYDEMLKADVLVSHALTEQEANQQKHLFKRYNSALPRIENRKNKGIPVPTYTGLEVSPSILSEKSLKKKRFVDCCQGILFSERTRKIIKPLPIPFKTWCLEVIMKIWFGEK